MEEDLRKFIHNLRGIQGIINYSLDVLDSKPSEGRQKAFERMLLRNLASTQLLLTDLVSFTRSEPGFGRSNELCIELSSLLHYLQVKRLSSISGQIQEQMDLLINALLSAGATSK